MNLADYEKQYNSDGTYVYSCQYHVIFCPKYRREILTDEVADRLKQIILDTQEEYQYHVLDMEIMPDHVHMILSVNPRTNGVYRVVSKIKGKTAKILRHEFPHLKSKLPCMWSGSRFISSVGSVSLEVVKQYIADQKGK